MNNENNVFMLPSRVEEARNVARKLAEQHVSIAYCALPDMGFDAFAHEVNRVLRTDFPNVKVVSVRVRDSMFNTLQELLHGLKEVGVDIDMSDLSRDSPDDFVYKALRNLPDGLQRLKEEQKVVILWSDFDRLDSGSVDELNPALFNFPEDFHLSTLLMSQLPIGSMWREGRCPDCLRNTNTIKPYDESELRDWCMGCGICGEDFETLWSECSGFPYVVATVVSSWNGGNRDWVGIQKRVEVRSAEYAESLFSLFSKIKLRRGGALSASLRACICSGAPLPSFATVLLDAYGLKRESPDFLPRTLVEWIKKENENSAETLQNKSVALESCVEWLRRQTKVQRFEICYESEKGYFTILDNVLTDDFGELAEYRLKESSRRKKIDVIAKLLKSFAMSTSDGGYIYPEKGESWHDKMNDKGAFQRFWRVETEGEKENGKDKSGRKIRTVPDRCAVI